VPGQNEFTIPGSSYLVGMEISTTLSSDFADSGLTEGLIQIDLRQSPTNYSSPAAKPLTFDITWELKEDEQVVDPNPTENNTNKTTETKDESSSDNTVLIVGGLGAFAVAALVVFIVLRIRNSDLEDWDEDDLDMEPEVEVKDRASKPLPVGVALDEFEDKTIFDESPDRPDLINEFDAEDEYEESTEESEAEYEDYEESTEEDSGITVDEHGTEWYEDEVGVWWFRDPGEEDWAEFVE